jgi:hypothetical protein
VYDPPNLGAYRDGPNPAPDVAICT